MDHGRAEGFGEFIMAIKQQPMVKDFWPRYKRKVILGTISMELLLAAIVLLAVVGTTGLPRDMLGFTAFIVALVAGSISFNLVLVYLITSPLKSLADTLTHVSGELTTVTPPNPNAKRLELNGLKPLIQYLYESASSNPLAKQQPGATNDNLVSKALNNTKAGIVVLDANGTIKFANNSAPMTIDTTGNKHLELLFDQHNTLEQWLASVRDAQVHAEKIWQRIPNKITGEEDRRIFDIAATFEKGNEAEVVLVMFDQSGIYQPEDDALDFIAFAAHELRGPITVIRGYLDVLGLETEGVLHPDQQELLKRLVVSASRLSGYINNILNASRYDRRHLQLHLTEDSIANVYDTINDDMQLRASSQNRLLNVNIPTNLPTIAADKSSLSEVLGNLIDNALKYSNEGGLVNVQAFQDGDFIKVAVEDHGIGMPGNVISNLFHKFYRSHRSRETVAGTGIGLYISKAIVESHGGKIGVISAEGKGSIFWFTVPIYATVKDRLLASGNMNTNANMITTGGSWIKNHSMYSG